MTLNDSLFIKACRSEATPRAPIWLMRQAGRYMSEYRALREIHGFMSLCKNPSLAAQITVGAAVKLKVDAAIIFSDLLLLVEPMGFELRYGKDQGPLITNPFRSKSGLSRLRKTPLIDSMGFMFKAIAETRQSLSPDIPIIGFAGAPFTMAGYIIEGRTSKDFRLTKALMHEDPDTWNALMTFLTDVTIDYLNMQAMAGAQALQIFDSWVGNLDPYEYKSYVQPHVARLIAGITASVPIILFGTKTAPLLALIKETRPTVVGVDWRISISDAWDILGDMAIMGNLDPSVLLTDFPTIRQHVDSILKSVRGRPGYIFNLGHGVLPGTPIENVHYLIDLVKEKSQR